MSDTKGSGPSPSETAAPVAPTAQPVLSQQPADDFNSRLAKARTPADIRAITEEKRSTMERTLKEQPPVKAEIPPDLKALEAEKPQTPAEETPAEPAPEETPAEPEPENEPEEVDDPDGPPQIPTAKQLRISPGQHDKLGRLTAALMRRNRDWDMETAMDKAKDQLGIKPKTSAPEPEKPKSDLPETVEAVDATLSKLEDDRAKALEDLQFGEVAKLDRELRKLDRHRTALERDGEKKQAQAAADYNRTFDTSETRAKELYEFVSNKEAPGYKRMLEIEADLELNSDPLFNDPNKPLRIAQMVAAELSIAPKRKGAPPAPAKAAAPVTNAPVPKKQVIPSGSSRSVAPATNQPPADVAQVQGLKTMGDVRSFLKSKGIPI